LYTPGSWRDGNLNLSIIFEVMLTDVDSFFFNKQLVMVGKTLALANKITLSTNINL
jgi:hypothetical protein